ncbi:hypothetical protein JY96_18320 [Aquabacterium sp. NJ1]|uniref:hypothetical protein n=1 Tax=Aquabacterium sp. NJ1 TaxID=1538295 RepID=UPI00052E0C36|nr:hypothetical protein [Aquabacterium sp. NJ1]KGM41360.1 hypothetical protein JY96_18320 [Aquabacterium sp. NJ1]
MIFVVEVPHVGEPRAWFAFHGEDLLNKVVLDDPLQSWEIYDTATARELLAMVGAQPDTPQARSAFPGICRLADEYGLDTALYRADHALERGCYQPDAVSIEAACEAALQRRVSADPAQGPLRDVRVYWSEPQAVLATEAKDDPLFTAPGGWRSLHALREQLLALDVLAEN